MDKALDLTAEADELFAYAAGQNAGILGFCHSERRPIGLGRDVKRRRA
jgi:hypothetical protein